MNIRNAILHSNFLKQKPFVAYKVINGYWKGWVLKKPVLRTVDFAVTNICNSKCKMCSAHHLYKEVEETREILTPDQIVNVFLQASKLGAMHINLTGGEPLQRNIDELCYIIKNIRPKTHLVSMVTNSLLVTQEKLRKLKNAGLDTIQLSIESMNPEIHDNIRGIPGNFAKVMQAFHYAVELNLIICLSTVLTRINFEEVEQIIEFAKNHYKKDIFVLLNPVSASGAMIGNAKLKLTSNDLERYKKLLEIGLVRADTVMNFSGKSGCPAGKERIHITAFGDVITCPHVQVSYGNIKEQSLRKIWQEMYSIPDLHKYSSVCKHAFDQEYYDKFLKPIEHIIQVPISVHDHPKSNEILRNR